MELNKLPIEVASAAQNISVTTGVVRLTFGLHQHLAPVEQELTQELILRNSGTTRKSFKFFPSGTPRKYQLTFYPDSASLDSVPFSTLFS